MKKIIAVMLMCLLIVPAAMADGLGNSIIIYFDYSENIVTDGLDVDAVRSASVAEGPGVREIGNLLVMGIRSSSAPAQRSIRFISRKNTPRCMWTWWMAHWKTRKTTGSSPSRSLCRT